jgi:hypothetical protein
MYVQCKYLVIVIIIFFFFIIIILDKQPFLGYTFFYRTNSSALSTNRNLEGQACVFMSLSDRVAQLHPQAPGSFPVSFHDSQDYGGGILVRLHTRQYSQSVTVTFRQAVTANQFVLTN